MRFSVALSLLLAIGCGGVHSVDGAGEPLWVFRAAAPAVDSSHSMRAALVWGEIPEACLDCLPFFDLAPRAVSFDVQLEAGASVIELPVYRLPRRAVLVDEGAARLGYGVVTIYADNDHNDQLDEEDSVLATSLGHNELELVTYREGDLASVWQNFSPLQCPAPKPGFSVARVEVSGRNDFSCAMHEPGEITLRLEPVTACAVDDCFTCTSRCSSVAHAERLCVSGQCGFVCDEGFRDCNLRVDDGCEVAEPAESCRDSGPWGDALLAVLDVNEDPFDSSRFHLDGSRSIATMHSPITQFRIEVGDGSPVVAADSTTHLYLAPGGYVARLFVTDESGAVSVDSVQLSVTSSGIAPPNLHLQFDNDELNATVRSSGAARSPVFWELGDGTTRVSDEPPEQLPGTYLRAVVVDQSGLDAVDRIALPFGEPSRARVDLPAGVAPLTAHLECASDEMVVWDFGDGTTGEGVSVQHTYLSAGYYDARCVAGGLQSVVEVRVFDSAGQLPPKILAGELPTVCVESLGQYPLLVRGTRPMRVVELVGAPEGMSIEEGVISWIPADGQVGSHSVTLIVENDAGQTQRDLAWVVDATCDGSAIANPSSTASGCGCHNVGLSPWALLTLLLPIARRRRRRH